MLYIVPSAVFRIIPAVTPRFRNRRIFLFYESAYIFKLPVPQIILILRSEHRPVWFSPLPEVLNSQPFKIHSGKEINRLIGDVFRKMRPDPLFIRKARIIHIPILCSLRALCGCAVIMV